jgi:RNA-directed DNA polymerase
MSNKPERKRKNLIRLGVNPDDAYAWSRTRKGGWAVAQSPILNTTITKSRLKKRGYYSLLEIYTLLIPSFYSLTGKATNTFTPCLAA